MPYRTKKRGTCEPFAVGCSKAATAALSDAASKSGARTNTTAPTLARTAARAVRPTVTGQRQSAGRSPASSTRAIRSAPAAMACGASSARPTNTTSLCTAEPPPIAA